MTTSREIAAQWIRDGRRVVAATLVEALGSSPFEPGATMYVNDDLAVEGTVTGGCVEAALLEEAQAVLGGGGTRLLSYGISDDIAAGVGLMCGGTVRILVAELNERAGAAQVAVAEAEALGNPAALATIVDGEAAGERMGIVDDRMIGGLGEDGRLQGAVERACLGALSEGKSVLRRLGQDGTQMGSDLRVWIDVFAPPPKLLILGAIDYSIAVAQVGRLLGFVPTICDARAPFVQSKRFSEVADVVVDWPDRFLSGLELAERDVVLVFTHDRKFDEPALKVALSGPAGYVGAMGSRRTQMDRAERLREAGVSEEELSRMAAPCGLDLGARTPAETALSIMAEVVAVRAGRVGGRLITATGSIRGAEPTRHQDASAA